MAHQSTLLVVVTVLCWYAASMKVFVDSTASFIDDPVIDVDDDPPSPDFQLFPPFFVNSTGEASSFADECLSGNSLVRAWCRVTSRWYRNSGTLVHEVQGAKVHKKQSARAGKALPVIPPLRGIWRSILHGFSSLLDLQVMCSMVTLGFYPFVYGRALVEGETIFARRVYYWFFVVVAWACVLYFPGDADRTSWWIGGYIMELIFSLNSVYIFRIVMKGMCATKEAMQKALVIVVLCQFLFQSSFFCVLAPFLNRCRGLPVVLGVIWIFVGVVTVPGTEMKNVSLIPLKLFGSRVQATYTEKYSFIVEHHPLTFSMMLPLTVALIMTDFLWEFDITLSKAAGNWSTFSCISSSSVAALALPELFLLVDWLSQHLLFQVYMSFVIFLYGIQLVFSELFETPVTVVLAFEGCVFGVGAIMNICNVGGPLEKPSVPLHWQTKGQDAQECGGMPDEAVQ